MQVPKPLPSPDPLNISGQQYAEVHNVLPDINTNPIYDCQTRFRWPASITGLMIDSSAPKSFLQYFELMFPMNYIPQIISATQVEFDKDGDNNVTVKKGLILKYFGLMLAITLHRNIGGKKGLWTEKNTKGSVLFQAYRFNERFNISRDFFSTLSAKFRLAKFNPIQLATVRRYYI
jgi:hypothetical protein